MASTGSNVSIDAKVKLKLISSCMLGSKGPTEARMGRKFRPIRMNANPSSNKFVFSVWGDDIVFSNKNGYQFTKSL